MATKKGKPAAKAAGKSNLRAAAKAGDFDALAKAALKPGRTIPPAPTPPIGEPRAVPVGSIKASPLNPRRDVDRAELMALSASIVAEGILEPLLVRPGAKPDHYEVIAGARRLAAVQMAVRNGHLAEGYLLPCIVRNASDAELVEWALVENSARADMSPVDTAEAIAALRKFYSDEDCAKRLGMTDRTFYRRVALLRLAPELKEDLRGGKITLQQAAAFCLGTPADQLEQRAKISKTAAGGYYSSPDAIRQAMLQKRVPVSKAMFPIADYTGEILTDPDNGTRYFANVAKFKELQDAAIAAKIKALKAEWPWVKEVPSYEQSSYRRLKKGETDAKAGAIHWRGYDNEWHSSAPVLDQNSSRKAEDTERKATAAKSHADERAYDELTEKVVAHLRATPHAALAIVALRAIESFDWFELDQLHPEKAPAHIRALLEEIEPVLAPAMAELDGDTFIERISDGGLSRIKAHGVAAYQALAALPPDRLLSIMLLAAEPWGWCIDGDGLNPLGMHIMQHELPLEAGKEAAE